MPSSSQTGRYAPQNTSNGQAVCVYHLLLLIRYLQKLMLDLVPRPISPLQSSEISLQIEVAFFSQPRSLDAALERFHFLGNYTSVKDNKEVSACVEEEHLVVVPLYPQYSSVHAGVAFDALTNSSYFAAHRTIPHLHFLRSYATKTAYINALTTSIRRYCAAHGSPDWLFVVFEGLSRRFITSGDCYQVECQRTFTALRTALSTHKNTTMTTPLDDGIDSTSTMDGSAEKDVIHSPPPFSSSKRLLDIEIPSNRITISFLEWGVEPCLEPSPSDIVSGIATMARQIFKQEISTSNPDKCEEIEKISKVLGTAYFVCPGMAVDDNRSLQVVQKQLCKQCLELGWLRAEYIPALNESPEQLKMLVSIISEYIH
ncbi:unnamed protein product [Phytomonas sp. Hart1]|nr:unnamed protein product [Phytomonas sp. Hart1]|eukprot:CCW69914.1 unnamed protein product [Phytomonas sp. isolate Hart1]